MLKNILKINRPDFIELTTETKTVTSKWIISIIKT